MNILVFCSAQDIPAKYTEVAKEFASLLARKGHVLVWGGSNRGTMKDIADAAQKAGGKIIGVSVEHYAHKARKEADEMLITKDLPERKKRMLEMSNIIVALAGGIGTLDELTEAIALKRGREHNKPILVLNTDNFYEGLKLQMERMEGEGFLKSTDADNIEGQLAFFASSPEEAMRYIESHDN